LIFFFSKKDVTATSITNLTPPIVPINNNQITFSTTSKVYSPTSKIAFSETDCLSGLVGTSSLSGPTFQVRKFNLILFYFILFFILFFFKLCQFVLIKPLN